MTYALDYASVETLHEAAGAAGKAFTAARRAFLRSRTAKNLAAFEAAQVDFEAKLAEHREAADAFAVADLRERRLAFVAPRRALLARQFSMAL